jgi:hypothetical protein
MMMRSTQRTAALMVSSRTGSRLQPQQPTMRRFLSSEQQQAPKAAVKHAKTSAGTGRVAIDGSEEFARNRGPVSWAALGLVAVASASAVGYFKVERERRLERAMGKVVSSMYKNGGEDDGWSPNPEFLAKRKWKLTKFGWFPEEDAFGGGELRERDYETGCLLA